MMDRTQKLVIEVDPLRATVVLKQDILGVTSRKDICPEDLFRAIIHATNHVSFVPSGLLPRGCFSVELCESGAKRYCLLCQQRYADITYHNTLYERFPLPKLVFGFQILEQGKVSNCRLGVVADEELKSSTEMFCYPFSNVTQSTFHLCTGNNVLPVYKSPSGISNLPGYLLRLPNNDDSFDVMDNRLHMEYRDLLEHLKDKDPSYYYSDVLIPNGKTLKDFIGG